MLRRLLAVTLTAGLLAGCTLKDEDGIREDGTIAAPADVAAPPEDAIRTESGLASKVLRLGGGMQKPGPRATVVVHYTGWKVDGEMFDSSVASGRPIQVTLNDPRSPLIDGWTEGLQLMVAGEKRRFWIPGTLAYDHLPPEDGYPRGMLVFDIELLEIK